MTIWLLALVLLASLAGLGYRQGAIRVAFSFIGIVLGAFLAGPLGKLVKPLLLALGLKTPTLAWLLAPLIVFVLISVIFKVAALMVHQKVDVHFKYNAGDLRLALWERMHHRLGLCLGLANGALYIILLSVVIYPFGYWTAQVATSDEDPRSLRILNRLGHDLQDSGFAKVARALDPMPQVWYDSADFVGLIYNNPLSEARLSRYPALLSLGERPEFQDIAQDTSFMDIRLKGQMDGIEAADIIRKKYFVPVIFLTAHSDESTLQRALVSESYGYIIKPFEAEKLREKLNKFINV